MPDKLVVVRGTGAGAEFPVHDSPSLLGAGRDCQIRLPDAGLRERHAVLERNRSAWHLRVLDVKHPVECGGRLTSELRLEHGLVFQIGGVHLRFVTPRATIESSPLAEHTVDRPEEAIRELAHAREKILGELGKLIIGQQEVIEQVMTALFARGHCLLIGAPGLAKTLLVRTLAGALDLDARRIQFTPDLMPSDITGTDILEEDTATGRRSFRFCRGPLFANILLADEINRTPPKTQAALLEAMQEQRVSASGTTYDLPQPFLVLATQNPIELEGTYPLPEAQLDRFMFSIHIDYPTAADEPEILLSTTRDRVVEVDRVLNADSILRYQHLVRQVPVSRHVADYAAALVRATRPDREQPLDFVSRCVRWGAGPRAGQYLLLAAKAHVLLQNRFNVSCDDVRRFALPVMRHRIFRNFTAASEGITADDIVKRVLAHVKEPEY